MTWAYNIAEDHLCMVGHVYPENDIIEHRVGAGQECPCQGSEEDWHVLPDGRWSWNQIHRSLRERVETDQQKGTQ